MRKIVETKDGSHTIVVPEKGVMYHSVHGAIQESRHVFIEAGLRHVSARPARPGASVFEMGFGTGLNAFLTAVAAMENKQKIFYTAIETAPLTPEEARALNYTETLGQAALFDEVHQCRWNEDVAVTDFFSLYKTKTELSAFTPSRLFDLIYYDAFVPSAQPELWTKEVFQKLYAMLLADGVLVTYCAKGDVRRAMSAADFKVERLPGPRGKREMLRALKRPSL